MNTLTNEAAAFNQAIADSAPVIAPIPDCTVPLLRGLLDSTTGEWQMTATVRELTGEDEERIAALTLKDGEDAYSAYMEAIIQHAVTSVGTIDTTTNKAPLNDLMIGDRDLLFLGCIRATYGQIRTLLAQCGACGESNDVHVDLIEDFPVKESTKDLHKPLLLKTRKGVELKFRIPTAADAKFVNSTAETTAEINTHMIARCAVFDDHAPEDRVKWAKSLNLGDRNKIVKAIFDAQAGPKTEEVKAQCAHCDKEMSLVIDWVSLLLG